MAVLWLYPAADIRDPRFSAYFRFETVVVVLFAVVLWQINRWWAAFLLLSFVSSIYPFSTKVSTDAFFAVLLGSFWFYVLSKYIKPDQIKYLLDAICVLALCNIVMLTCQYFGIDPIFKAKDGGSGTPLVGFLSNKNEVSAFLAFCLPAFFRDKWVRLTPLVFLGLTVASSTGGTLAAVVATMVFWLLRDGRGAFIKNWWKTITLLVWFLLFLGYFDTIPVDLFDTKQIIQMSVDDKYQTEITAPVYSRFEAWAKGLDLYKQHWIFGSGIGHWKIVFKSINLHDTWFKHAHNEFLQSVFEFGIFFVVMCSGYLFSITKKIRSSILLYNNKNIIIPTAAIVAICLNSLVNFPFHIAQTAILAVTWMAIFEVQSAKTV